MTRILLLSLAVSMMFALAFAATEKEETKYAPSYCLRFKLNCNSEQKKKHVCCLHPLPEGDAADSAAQQSSSANEEGGSSGGVKIRPIRLPQREKVSESENEETAERNSEPVKRPASDIRRNNAGSAPSPSSSAASKKAASSATSPSTPPPKRPRICIRLVVNCNSSPDHRCCKYAEEEGEKEDEKPEEVAKDAPVEQEEQVVEEELVEEEKDEEPVAVEDVKPVVKEADIEVPTASVEEEETPQPPPVVQAPAEVEDVQAPAEVEDAQANAEVENVQAPVEVENIEAPVEIENAQAPSEVENVQPPAEIEDVQSPAEIEDVPEKKLTFESVINDQVPVVLDDQPYERIPAECFTQTFDCQANPANRCCDFQ